MDSRLVIMPRDLVETGFQTHIHHRTRIMSDYVLQ